ncbi:restriction endonuclease subunit S [Nostoc sp. LEGE 06077]|uniref:restriction endonuclease subunit S n=1 Tax=Nostoc sp. LEGE 06077 TaxID=915325 RepID=UPI003A0FFFAB
MDCINKTAPIVDEPSPFKMIRTTNIRNGRVNLDSVKFVTEQVYRQWTRRQIPRTGDILLTREAPMGEVGMLVTDDYVFLGQRIVSYRTNPDYLDNKFLLYAFQSDDLQNQIKAYASGSTVQHMRVPDTKALQIPLPSLPEQKRIVAILDEAFEGIDRAIANAEKNLANSRELFESYLNAIFTQKNKRGEIFQLAEICEKKRVITYGVIKLGEHIDDGVPCLRTSNVRWLYIDVNGIKRISPSLSADYKRTILKGGEVLVNVRGTLGGVAVTTPEMAGWNISREVALVPIDIKRVHSAYLAYWIGAKTNQQWLSGVQKGAAYTGINLEDLRTLPVVVPDLKEQERLINSIEEVHSVSQRLEAIYRQKIAALNELKQSILQKAFTGELTADTANQTTKAANEGIAA